MIRRLQMGMLGATFALVLLSVSPASALDSDLDCTADSQCLNDKNGILQQCLTGRCNTRTNKCVAVDNETECDDDNVCTTGDSCTDGVCGGANATEGTTCEDNNPCTDSTCQAGQCSKSANAIGACGGTGTCRGTGICDAGVCNGAALAAGTECSDGDNCTDDVCDDAGNCLSNLRVCGDPDEDPCTIEQCDPADGVCKQTNKEGSCSDGNGCNGPETCVEGVCTSGDPPECDDNLNCTTNSCDPSNPKADPETGCVLVDTCDTNPLDCITRTCTENETGGFCNQTVTPNGGSCDDGNLCNGHNTCNAGACEVKSPPNCNDQVNCTDDTCTNVAPDPLPEAPGSYDAETGCLRTVKVCADSTPTNCVDRKCEEATGNCVDAPRNPNDACGDNNPCNGTQKCQNGQCVTDQAAPGTCADTNPCTTDSCDPTACGDEPCQPDKLVVCKHVQKNCDDTQTCTLDSCDPDTGNCLNQDRTAGTKCTDGNQCTAEDTCVSGVCTSTKDTDCGDDNVCTTDTCDPNEGCLNEVTDGCETSADCNDDNACNGVESCVKAQGEDVGDCTDGSPATCGGKPVTAGICTTGNDANIVGTSGDDVMAGLGGDDTMSGLGGNDTMCGNAGNDLMAGNQGNDVVAAGKGDDTVRGGQGGDTIMGQAGNDRLLGQTGDDRLSGGPGTDRISGGSGTDNCSGGENVTGCP